LSGDARKRLEEIEAVCAALAHASRRQILMTVHFRDGMTAGDIAGRFHVAWPTISRHLKVLEDAGLLTAERRGRERLYRVDHAKIQLMRDWLGWFDAKGG
jgi:DNA-binding transcriptional ArsR family regulator